MPEYDCKAKIRLQKTIGVGTVIADNIFEAHGGANENLGEDVFERSVIDDFKGIFQDTSK